MSKALVIWSYDSSCWEGNIHAVAFDIEKGKQWIEENNKPHAEECKIQEMCSECYGSDREAFETNQYKLRTTCPRASIKTDRNGEYCENELLNSHDMLTPYYSGIEVEIIG